MAIKLLTLNIERDRHLTRVAALLDAVQPDVVCLQEVFEDDAHKFGRILGASVTYLPMVYHKRSGDDTFGAQGIAVLSRLPVLSAGGAYYHRPDPNEIVRYAGDAMEEKRASIALCYAYADVAEPETDRSLRVMTTHFTWTPNGESNDYQLQDAEALLRDIDGMPPFVLCGDFNVPRGQNEVYDILTSRFNDAVPPMYETSLDLQYHRVRNDPVESARLAKYMVDYIFLSDGVYASDVGLLFGVSDHAAVVGSIYLVPETARVSL